MLQSNDNILRQRAMNDQRIQHAKDVCFKYRNDTRLK